MTDKAISPLRRRLIEDMTIRGSAPRRTTSISAMSKSLPISWAGLPTRPPPRMSIAINYGWPRGRAEADRIKIAVVVRLTLAGNVFAIAWAARGWFDALF